MKTISPLDMQICDVNSEFLGVPRYILMENAGAHLATVCKQIITENESNFKEVIVFAGKGGNGGDGLVAARHLARTHPVRVILASTPREITSHPARKNWDIIQNMNLSVQVSTVTSSDQLESLKQFNPAETVILDCLLGTGVTGNLREPIKSLAQLINHSKENGSYVISADIPTGLNTEGGSANNFVKADLVVSFHAKKLGVEDIGAKSVVANIGCPPEAEIIAGPGDLIPLRQREKWDHKGDSGKVLVIGGSKIYSGAPALAAKAALKSGVDLITILTSPSVAMSIRSMCPNFIVHTFSNVNFDATSVEQAKHLIQANDAVILGPGLGNTPETLEAVSSLVSWLKTQKIPCVIDADALKAVSKPLSPNFLLTPHAGEFYLLSNTHPPKGDSNVLSRVKTTNQAANSYKATILLKGPIDVISSGENWKINVTGTPKMTVGGTGDILAGLAGGLLATTQNTYRSAIAAAYINGLAGEEAERRNIDFSTAKILDQIPFIIAESWKFIREEEHQLTNLTRTK